MSDKYTIQTAAAETKHSSRIKIAEVIKSYKHGKKLIHHLGGRNDETHFENLFGLKKKTSFVRYEYGTDAPTPKKYTQTTWNRNRLNDKKDSEFGWFANDNFWDVFTDFAEAINDVTHHYWLDFCGMPTPETLSEIENYFDNDDDETRGEVFLTFFLNPRGRLDVANMVNKYGAGLEDKAKSLCEYLNERFQNTKWEVFDTYNNKNSPMGVFRMKNDHMITKTEKPTAKKHSAEQYAIECKRFSNKQLAVLWRKSTMQIAGYAAQAKRKGLLTA